MKNFVLQNNFFHEKSGRGDSGFNNNISREIVMFNKHGEYGLFILKKYKELENFVFCVSKNGISFSEFLKCFILENSENLLILLRSENLDEFIKTNFNNNYEKALKFFKTRPHFSTHLSEFFKSELSLKNLDDIREYLYMKSYNMVERPKCLNCSNKIEFISCSEGFRDFCSKKCQLDFRNSIKPPKMSEKSDDEIRKILEKIPLDVRNLATLEVANNYLNIQKYSEELSDLQVTERIYLFMNKFPLNESFCCYCGSKKKFISQGKGYLKSCGKESCKQALVGKISNIFKKVSKGGCSYDETFIYLLKSENNADIFKIGLSQNPLERLKKIQRSSGLTDLKIFFCMYKENPFELEQKLHKIFENKKLNFEHRFDGSTEFFTLNEEDIEFIKKEIIKW